MEQIEFFEIPSPCVGVCQSNDKGYCMGCFRNRNERFYWQKLTDSQKREVLRVCRLRKVNAIRKKLRVQALSSNETDSQSLSLFDD